MSEPQETKPSPLSGNRHHKEEEENKERAHTSLNLDSHEDCAKLLYEWRDISGRPCCRSTAGHQPRRDSNRKYTGSIGGGGKATVGAAGGRKHQSRKRKHCAEPKEQQRTSTDNENSRDEKKECTERKEKSWEQKDEKQKVQQHPPPHNSNREPQQEERQEEKEKESEPLDLPAIRALHEEFYAPNKMHSSNVSPTSFSPSKEQAVFTLPKEIKQRLLGHSEARREAAFIQQRTSNALQHLEADFEDRVHRSKGYFERRAQTEFSEKSLASHPPSPAPHNTTISTGGSGGVLSPPFHIPERVPQPRVSRNRVMTPRKVARSANERTAEIEKELQRKIDEAVALRLKENRRKKQEKLKAGKNTPPKAITYEPHTQGGERNTDAHEGRYSVVIADCDDGAANNNIAPVVSVVVGNGSSPDFTCSSPLPPKPKKGEGQQGKTCRRRALPPIQELYAVSNVLCEQMAKHSKSTPTTAAGRGEGAKSEGKNTLSTNYWERVLAYNRWPGNS